MPPEYQAILFIGLFLALTFLQVPIAIALFVSGLSGMVAMIGVSPALGLLSRAPMEFAANWSLSAVPMFLLMGNIVARSGMADVLFALFQAGLRRVPGGVAVAANFACAGFGTASGSSLAATVGVGRMAVPQMLQRGYDPGLTAAVVGCAGTIAALIPPSISFIVFAIITEQSVLTLFTAGIVPCLLTVLAYTVVIVGRCKANPALAGQGQVDGSGPEPGDEVRMSVGLLLKSWPIFLLAAIVIGGLYGGVVTPTEAGGLGALTALMIALLRRSLPFKVFRAALRDTAMTTSGILIVAVAASTLSAYLSLAGLPDFVAGELSRHVSSDAGFLVIVSVVLLVLGMVLDPLSVMLLTTPIFLPSVSERGFDMIWFGVIVVKYIEIGLITPPLGLNLFAAHGLMPSSVGFMQVVRGALWFILAELVVMILLLSFPGLMLWLPDILR